MRLFAGFVLLEHDPPKGGSVGRFVSVDRSTGPYSTGGYPNFHDRFAGAQIWREGDDALKYRKTMGKEKEWRLMTVHVDLEEDERTKP